MGPQTPGVVVADAGALIAIERGDRAVRALLHEAETVIVPAGVVAQVWRGSARQALVAEVLGSSTTRVEPLDGETACVVGIVCARAGTSDIVDGSVAVAGLVHGAVVVTSDPDDIRALAPQLAVEGC